MGLLRTLLLGDIGNYLDNQELKEEHQRTRKKLNKKHSIDKKQDELIKELQQENVELKYTLSALVKLLHQKDLVSKEELIELSNIENEIESNNENIEPSELLKRFKASS